MKEKNETYYSIKGFFKFIYATVTWTLFVLLLIAAVLLIYYYISVRLYAVKGEKYEPRFSIYTIVSGSMEPTISVYDVIINTRLDNENDVKVNDVITFISTWEVNSGMTITHRVIGIKILDDGSKCFVTRGDANTLEDPTCVRSSNVIGITKAVIPGLGKLQSIIASRFGWVFMIIIPAVYVIIKDVLKIIRLSHELEDDKKNPKDNKKDKPREIP